MAAQNIISATILEACRIRNLSASASQPLCACRSLARLSSGSLTSLSSWPCKSQGLFTSRPLSLRRTPPPLRSCSYLKWLSSRSLASLSSWPAPCSSERLSLDPCQQKIGDVNNFKGLDLVTGAPVQCDLADFKHQLLAAIR